MKHPDKWRDTVDPFSLPYRHFTLTEVLGYPHAGNDVFQVKGMFRQQEVEAFIKVARQRGADIQREIDTVSALNWPVLPEIIDYGENFVVTLAKEGERLSTILGDNAGLASMDYLYEYGQALAMLHKTQGHFPPVKDRSYFHIPELERLEKQDLGFIHSYLEANRPQEVHTCFCHGDFHYANILWKDKHISAILDFELSGMGNREFDIAWALILRPGQRFLKTEEEIRLFLDGYRSQGSFNAEYVTYYMVQIYARFYALGEPGDGYREHVMDFFRKVICP